MHKAAGLAAAAAATVGIGGVNYALAATPGEVDVSVGYVATVGPKIYITNQSGTPISGPISIQAFWKGHTQTALVEPATTAIPVNSAAALTFTHSAKSPTKPAAFRVASVTANESFRLVGNVYSGRFGNNVTSHSGLGGGSAINWLGIGKTASTYGVTPTFALATSVPEPATVLLLSVGIASLGATRRRRRL